MEEVISRHSFLLAVLRRSVKGKRTGVEGRGDGVEHDSVHVRMDDPVRRSVVACGDEHRIALCNGNVNEVDRRLLNVGLQGRVNFSGTVRSVDGYVHHRVR